MGVLRQSACSSLGMVVPWDCVHLPPYPIPSNPPYLPPIPSSPSHPILISLLKVGAMMKVRKRRRNKCGTLRRWTEDSSEGPPPRPFFFSLWTYSFRIKQREGFVTKSTKNAQPKQTQEKWTFSSESGSSELVLLLKVGGNSPGLRTQVVPIVSSGIPTPQSPLPSFSSLVYLPSSVVPLAGNEV